MNRQVFATVVLALAALPLAPGARAQTQHHARRDGAAADGYRPLDVGGRHHYGPIIYRKNEIIAPGGFSAHGYGPGPDSEEARRADRNADVRARTGGVYGYGLDGLGGTQVFGDREESGYNNPNWGNAFSSYVGYNGTPTALAFGPGFANRYITDHEPGVDDEEDAVPSPQELGYHAPAEPDEAE